ncbi:DsbA family protein [Carnobacterium funditum]|uniref:DsbA family protein n=1 Tax=Carnobacterium funditum TaxID=2752 RepID=UPI00068A336B|nr:DsbA family protein [Carnobacterium funditum]
MLSSTHSSKGNQYKQVTEIYLFINPIGSACYQAEKGLLDFIESNEKKIHFHFIPVHNFKTFSDYMKAKKLPKNDLDLRNKHFFQIYEACLAYAAASMQGKKKGRIFLMALQQAIAIDNQPFSQKLVYETALKSNLDIPMFSEDKQSEFAKTAFEADQKVAREMHVLSNPSCVVFNDQSSNHGLLIEEDINFETLQALCNEGKDKNQLAFSGRNKKKNHLFVL